MNWQALWISALSAMLPASLMLMFPYWQRTFYFTVRVPAAFHASEEGQRIARWFRLMTLSSGLICGLAMYEGIVQRVAWLVVPAPLLNSVLLIAFLLAARKRTLPFAAPPSGAIRRAALVADSSQPWWIAASVVAGLAIVATAAAFVSLHWNELPERFPVHWGADGRPNRWARKNMFGVYGPLFIGLAVQAKLAFILFGLTEAGSAISARRRLNQVVIALANLFAAVLIAVVMLLPLRATSAALPGPQWVWMLLPLLFAVPTVMVAWRLQKSEDDEVEPTLDRNWWGGILYSDRADSRMMVPNRIGPGYTFNLGNPVVRIVVPLLILWVLGTVAAIPVLGQPDVRAAQARQAATDFARGDFAALYNKGAPVLRNAVTQPAFEAKLSSVAAALGACQAPTGEPAIQGDSFLFRVECAKQTVGINVVLDPAGLVQGFFLRPPPPQRSATPNLEVITGEFRLPARLALPAGAGPFACVVLVHGSGPHDMDETVMGNKPFRDLADGLRARGVATLRYDKRTQVYGARSAVKTLADETTDDAVSAARLCAAQPKIDPSRVFVLGHSLGGYAAPRIGQAAGKLLRGVIVMAGTSRPLDAVIDEQIAYLGAPVEQAAAVKKMIPESWWKDVEGYDPPALAASQALPFLVLQGERDYQVTMADFARWRAALGKSGRAVFKTYPKLNHLFIAGQGKPGPAEYARPGKVAEAVIDDIAAWVNSPSSAAAPH